MPDFDQKQDRWGPPSDPQIYTWCGPVSVANSLWWLDSEYESFYNPSPVPPPTISDSFPLVTSYAPGVWDDHDPLNVDPLVKNLAFLMDTDGQRTGLWHTGTSFIDMEVGISQYLQQQGVNPVGDCDGDGDVDDFDIDIINDAMGSVPGDPNWNMAADIVIDNVIDINDATAAAENYGKVGMFYEHTEEFANFTWIEEEVERCEDVVLFLEFWNDLGDGEWEPLYDNPELEAGHYVTVAGVNSTTYEILISDPYQDAYEKGAVPGHSPVPHPYPHASNVHNDTQYVSHDLYPVNLWSSPPFPYPSPYGIPVWELVGYLGTLGYPGTWHAFIRAAIVTSPLGVHDIAVTSVTTSKNGCLPMPTLCQNYTVRVNVTILNEGDFTENVTVTAYANTTAVGAQTYITLAPNASATLTIIWNTTGFAKGNYTISAYATPVPNEIDTSDNNFTDGWIIVTLIGDINGDFTVDLKDVYAVAVAYGSYPGHPRWNPNLDINDDNTIDLKDYYATVLNYGKTDP
jgi:hypothetical protein